MHCRQDSEKGQRNSDISTWLSFAQKIAEREIHPIFWGLGDPGPQVSDPLYGLREVYSIPGTNDGYEPFVVIHEDAPGWRERFRGFGEDRNSHVSFLQV